MRNFEVNEDMRRYFESLFNIEKEMNKNTEDIINDMRGVNMVEFRNNEIYNYNRDHAFIELSEDNKIDNLYLSDFVIIFG